MNAAAPVLQFASLLEVPDLLHGFTLRVPGLEVITDRESALNRLDIHHRRSIEEIGAGGMPLITAQQVHDRRVTVVDADTRVPVPESDGLVTAESGVCLGIYGADCAALFAVDPVRHVLGLAHSGRKGTELGIATVLIETMRDAGGSDPRDLIVQLSPCIRPPHYETDFAGMILEQCRAAGVRNVSDCGENTGADLHRFYSYRMEKGRTGRMLALLARRGDRS